MLITGTEKLTTSRLFKFLKEHSTAYIQAPGCVEELDKFAVNFMKNEGKRSKILKKAQEYVEKIECKEVSDT